MTVSVPAAAAVAAGSGAAGPLASASLVTRTAVTLKMGCLETGSHSVRVASLAAVGAPSGPLPPGLSK